jgi:tetratricopeptide (TPR) repeat protein
MDLVSVSPHEEVLLLLDRVASDPESVAERALVLANETVPNSEVNSEVLALAQRCYGLSVRGGGNTHAALLWLQKSVDQALTRGLYSIAGSSQLALASTLAMSGDFSAALQATETALPLLPEKEVAAALSRRAIFLQRLERNAEAVVAYQEAVERADSDKQTLELAKALNNRGLFRVDLGDIDGAVSDLLESSNHFLRLGLVDASASSDHNLGWCFARQGLVVEALNAYDRSDAKGGLGNSATWEGAFDRAEVYVSARLLPEALYSAKHADRLAGKAGFECEVPTMSLQLGRIQAALGDVFAAEESFLLAEKRFRDQGQNSSADLARICRLLIARGSDNELSPGSVRSLSEDDPHGYRDTVVDVAYGELLRLRLRAQPVAREKLEWLEGLLESGLASTNSLTRLQACAARLVILRNHDLREHGIQSELVDAAEKLFDELGDHLEGIHSQELRTVVVDKIELEALFCEAALSIGDPGIFRLWMGQLRSAVSAPGEPEQPSIQSRNPIEPSHLNNLRLSNSGAERSALEFAVRSTHWTTKSKVDLTRLEPFDPSVQRNILGQTNSDGHDSPARRNTSDGRLALSPGQVMLVYAQDSTNVVCSVITEHTETIEIVGSLKDIRTRSESVSLAAAALFGSNTGGSERAEQRAISVIRAIERLEALVLPVVLPAGDLLVSTTGSLGAVPWNLFARLAGRAVILTSSMGGGATNEAVMASKRIGVGIVEGPELQHSSREVNALAELYHDPIVLRGSEASVEAVCDLLVSAEFVHVAAHGRRRVDNALFSGIELFDGPLMAYDIERLSRTPKTVVLSCCDLGAANSQGAFGLLGFSGALVSRGTSQVAAAVLPVSDEISGSVMHRFHQALGQGLSVSQAVAQGVANAGSLFERVTAGSYVVKGP